MLILLNENNLQALERITTYNSWTTIVLLVLFAIIFILKALNSNKLTGYTISLFSKGFVEKETTEKTVFFKGFYSLIFFFTILVLALVLNSFVIDYVGVKKNSFVSFFKTFLILFAYFSVKIYLEYLLSSLFLIKNQVRFFLVSKTSYLYNISILLLVAFVIFEYSFFNNNYLYFICLLLFLIRFILLLLNNKNLIFSKLFYFILYLCAFEIAPLFLMVKLLL